VASQYVSYDAARDRYYLTPEQAFAFAAADGLHCPGAYNVVSAMFKDIEGLEAAFRDGGGFGWHQHHPDLFHGTERFFRPNYAMNLVPSWIPALEGVEPKLRAGARVADVGCGHGVSTVLMAQAFPKSAFVGFDYHEASIQRARQVAQESGVGDRLRFEVASARNFPGGPYDLVTFFDCLHDMGDPAGASRHVRESLKPDGTWMVVEPYAEDEPTANFNPLGRLFYSASTMVCTPCSLAQDVGAALGAQAGEKRISQVIRQGGFRSVRRAAETPFNLVFEARP
jgi:ubiquinone/menaquinone biosynthesis C-methylase UbiE